MDKNIYVQMFSNCIPVKGAAKSIICDLQNQTYFSIPNEMFQIITQLKHLKYVEVLNQYEKEDQIIIQEYVDYLIEKGLGFLTSTPEKFPDLSAQYEDPALINNALIDLNEKSKYNMENLIIQLEEVLCRHIQIRFFKHMERSNVSEILELIRSRKSLITSIELLMPYNKKLTNDSTLWFRKFPRLFGLIFYKATKDDHTVLDSYGRFISYTQQVISGSNHCGFISPGYFVVNTSLFTESQNFNNCLYKKIGVDVEGNIKNCPSTSTIYGHISNHSIKEISLNMEFQKIGAIHKDQIKVCQDCEFRYICTDCRAFLKKDDEFTAKPARCGYNPYKGSWN